ncbi:maleylpyruvate isomerase N-terminal domain-containing protein [Streptomyces sp. HJ7]
MADGAGRPAAELAEDVRSALARLVEDARAMPAGAWEAPVRALAGWAHPAWYTLYRCWRELETHHVDLGAGYRTADWPAGYVAWALDSTLSALAARDFPLARVEAVDLERVWSLSRAAGPTVAGPGHALLGWLSGRSTEGVAVPAGRLPVPPAWPLPPFPGWDGAGEPGA